MPVNSHPKDSAVPLNTYCQAVADGTIESRGVRGWLRRTVCVLVRAHVAGVPF